MAKVLKLLCFNQMAIRTVALLACILLVSHRCNLFAQTETIPPGSETRLLKDFRYAKWIVDPQKQVVLEYYKPIKDPTPEQRAKKIFSVHRKVVLPGKFSELVAESLDYISIAHWGAKVCPKDIDASDDQVKTIEKAFAAVNSKIKQVGRGIKSGEIETAELLKIGREIKGNCSELRRTTLLDFQITRIKQVQIESIIIGKGIAQGLSTLPISEHLKLTPDQKKKLFEKKKELEARLQTDLKKLILKHQELLLKELSPDQQKEFEKLKFRNGKKWQRGMQLRMKVVLRLSRL